MSSYKDKLKTTKLYIALIDTAREEKTLSVIKCLEEGANGNEQFANDSNNTPLHISVMNRDLEVVNLLLQRGAKTYYKNNNVKTALDVAKELETDVGQSIVELLEKHESDIQANKSNKVNVTDKKNGPKYMYQKRDGTSGIKGQLYETKLITLIRIRLFIKECDQFYLGTSLAGIGALDDICIRYKQNNEDVIVCLQAKHRTEVTKGKILSSDLWKPTGDFSLLKYFNSYLKIRERFNNTKNCDVMFNGKYEDLKCYLVIYTSAGNELKSKKTPENRSTDNNVRDLIQSGEYSDIFQYQYTDGVVDLLSKSVLVHEMKCLGKSLFSFKKKNNFDMMLNDCHIRKYHVLLARSVFNVSDVNSAGHRTGTFRDDFFNNNDELLVELKEVIFSEAVKGIKLNRDNLKELVQAVILEPTAVTVSKLMQKVSIYYQTNTGAITIKADKDLSGALSEVKIGSNIYKEACDIAVKEKLNTIRFKLPTTFGNIDIVVSDGRKGAKRLEYLATKIENIISYFKDKNIIINHELIGPNKLIDAGVMELKGGIGSTVGNLLILSEDGKSYKFNVNYETLGKNSKMLLKLLKSKIDNLESYRLKLNVAGFPKLSFKTDARDRILVKEFFNNLWFYTNQAKENEIENHGKDIVENYCITRMHAFERTATNIRYEAIYFKIHADVQKWWMSEGDSYYLTKDREYFDDILKEILESSLLFILSCIYMKRTKTYEIQFDEASIQSLCTQFGPECIVIVTEAVTLTGIKLAEYFQTLNDYAFIEIDSPLLLSRYDRNILKQEIKSNMVKTLIIIYEDVSESKSELFRYLTKETASKQLIIVTGFHSYEKIYTFFIDDHKFIKVSDEKIQFSDLVPMSQRKLLNSKLKFQGTEIPVDDIIQEDAKYLITPCIIQKIINNEKIEVGRSISNPNYEEIKYYYVDRQLSIEKESHIELFSQLKTEQLKTVSELFPPKPKIRKKNKKNSIKINTLEDINDSVVLIGAPGTGKSSFLTHMSIKTKQKNPKIWIVRINLLDYTKEFHRWQQSKINIDHIEALKFVCKAAVIKKTSKNSFCFNFDEIVFDLEIFNEEFVLRNYEARNCSVFFDLQLFIYCYNKGNTVFVFDGFDEICPHYKDEITDLLKCLVTRSSGVNPSNRSNHKQRMWIASRSYKNIIVTLRNEFGALYDLESLTEPELKTSITRFLKINLNLNELNNDQLMNINGLFEYLKMNKGFNPKKSELKSIQYSTFLLNLLYSTAVEYFQSEKENIQLTAEKYSLAEKWRSINKFKVHISDLLRLNTYRLIWTHLCNESRRIEVMMLAIITPLHMYIALDYFVNKIKNTDIVSKWNLEMNTSCFYKYFLETKLKKIRYEQKNQMNLCNPDVKLTYERELKEFLDKHQKIAFYATFIEELDEILTQVQIDEIRKFIKEFEAAEEKTGVVDYVINGVPKFIHLTLQEYLTVEYITVLLKTSPQEDQPKLWKFIISYVRKGVLEFFDRKFQCDNELKSIITLSDKVKETIFNVLDSNRRNGIFYKNCLNIVDEAVILELRYTSKFLIKNIIDVINEDNLKDFIILLLNCSLFNTIAEKRWNDILIIILDCTTDPRMLGIFDYGIKKRDFANFSNEEIIRDINFKLNSISRIVALRRYSNVVKDFRHLKDYYTLCFF